MDLRHIPRSIVDKTELDAATEPGNFDVLAKDNGTIELTSENDEAAGVADAPEVPLEKDPDVKITAARLGLPSFSNACAAFPLSEPVQKLLGAQSHELTGESPSLWSKLCKIIDASEIIWQNGRFGGVAVLKCSADVAVKIIPNFEDFTEYTSLLCLRQHAPEVPVPEPLGAMRSGKTAFVFMSFIPGLTLESVWTQLRKELKISLSNRLSQILLKLRELKQSKDDLLGGVAGEGCKDSRRHTRISQKPIRSIAEFEDFVFSNPHFGGSVYIKLLRGMLQSHKPSVVFSHGDLRPANIMVQPDQQGGYNVSAILDWEMSGFYPDYWESVKATNTMAPQEEDDWYLYLPTGASPTNYPLNWLVDRKWDVHVA